MGASSSIQHKAKSRSNTPLTAANVDSANTVQANDSSSPQESARNQTPPNGEHKDPADSSIAQRDQSGEDSGRSEAGVSGRSGADETPRAAQRSSSMEPKDIMISYSHQDRDRMRIMRDALEKAGITVWVDETGLKAGVEFLNKIGQAIIDAKLFLSLLSTKSATSKYCKDELALAYVSSKPIFPCMIEPYEDVTEVMDFGMKLQLAPIKWFDFKDEEKFEDHFEQLADSIKSMLKKLSEEQVEKEEGKKKKKHPVLERRETRSRLNTHRVKQEIEPTRTDFWECHFKNETKVPVDRFVEVFREDSSEELKKMGVSLDWIIPVLTEELDEEQDDFITKDGYEHFCIIDNVRQDFWDRVREQALERYTMLEVFSMDSTVRLDAIQNLAKFHTRSVVEAMMDLCSDRDDNVKAVAALSLARVATSDDRRVVRRLLRLLKDRDRLVRQSGCLALGHMKAKQAVPSLVQLWRNDAISNVREAAHAALEIIGGDEAQEAIHITKVLSSEIKALAQQK